MNTNGRSRNLVIIVVVIIGILILASDSTGKRVDDTFSPSGDIANLQIENGSVDFKIVEGDSFYVKGENLDENSYTFTQEGDTLIIKANENNIDFFHFSFFVAPQRITLTIPRDTQFNSIKINNGSGDSILATNLIAKECSITVASGRVDAEAIKAETFDSNIGSGDLEVKDLTADNIDVSVGSGDVVFGYAEADKMNMVVGSGDFTFKGLEARDCDLEVGSGDVEGKNVQIMNLSAQTGSGDIYLKGALTGVSEFICGSGDIDLNLDGDIDDYSFEIDGSDIEINGEDYSKKYKSDVTMDKQLHLKAGSGDIDVTIR